MSRIGKHPVDIPSGVDIQISGQEVKAKGKLGELSLVLMDEVNVAIEENKVVVSPRSQSGRGRQMWGTARSLVDSLVTGVSEGFSRELEITGVGYRAQVQGKNLVLQLGYSHEVLYPIEPGITIECPDQTHIVIKGADKQRIGQIASEIRGFRPPEPYKGKGIRYNDEYVLRKEGKKK